MKHSCEGLKGGKGVVPGESQGQVAQGHGKGRGPPDGQVATDTVPTQEFPLPDGSLGGVKSPGGLTAPLCQPGESK